MLETLEIDKYLRKPLQNNLLSLYNHIGRYYQAIKDLNINKNDIVLDIACGQGYGSYLLAQKARYVYGLDVNQEFLAYAKLNMQVKNNSFLNISNITGITYNKAVCIETIEHMENNKQIELLMRISNAKELFLTFPIGKNEPSKYNPYHLCEPSIDFILAILIDEYKKIKINIETIKNDYGHKQEMCILRGIKC